MRISIVDDKVIVFYCGVIDKTNVKEKLSVVMKKLKKNDYIEEGYYDLYIYNLGNITVLEFENTFDDLDCYFNDDINVEVNFCNNSNFLYEIEDFNYLSKKNKTYYYNNKFYIEDNNLSEFGNLVYGDYVKKVLQNGIDITELL